MRWAPPLIAVATIACNALVGFGELERVPAAGPEDPAPEDDTPEAGIDGGKPKPRADAGPAKPPECDKTKPFGTPVLLPGAVNAPSALETSPSLTDDELTLFFGRLVGSTDVNMVMATRAAYGEPFGDPRTIPGFNATTTSHAPTVTGDGLELFWSEQVLNATELTITSARIMTARRTKPTDDFGPASLFRPGNENLLRTSPFVTRDGKELFFAQFEAADTIHIYRSLRNDDTRAYEAPTRVNELASTEGSEGGIAMSSDFLTMFFASSRTGSTGPNDMYLARRQDRSSPWTSITRIPEVSSASTDRPGWLSPDGCRLYMASEREGAGALFMASKPAK